MLWWVVFRVFVSVFLRNLTSTTERNLQSQTISGHVGVSSLLDPLFAS